MYSIWGWLRSYKRGPGNTPPATYRTSAMLLSAFCAAKAFGRGPHLSWGWVIQSMGRTISPPPPLV